MPVRHEKSVSFEEVGVPTREELGTRPVQFEDLRVVGGKC
jgi:hypothetical protein